MQQFLNSQLYQLKDIQEMKSSLLENFKEDVSWLEVYEKGSIIKVRYAAKEKIKKEKMNDKALIAKKDGMIVYFDCKQGNKVKKVHDVVHRGEVLVDNHMLDSQGKEVTVNVNGKVYAHTWKKVQVEVKNHLPEAVNYFNMLLTARDQISIDKEWGEQIVSENILQFDPKQDTMKLEILYTLLEDITS